MSRGKRLGRIAGRMGMAAARRARAAGRQGVQWVRPRFWQLFAIALIAALVGTNWQRVEGAAPRIAPRLFPGQRAQLEVTVLDARTRQPIQGAEVVLAETEQRFRSGPGGKVPTIQAPIIRDPRFRQMIAQLHGQLTMLAFKDGYRDTIYFGVRMHEGEVTELELWMYAITPEDRRLEPVIYQKPFHRIWIVELARRFRIAPGPIEQDIER